MEYFPFILQEEISIRQLYSVHYFENYKNYFYPGERHNFWEIVYVDRGEIVVETDMHTKPIHLERGDLILHRPNEFHRFYANNIEPHNLFVCSFACDSAAIYNLSDNVIFHLRGEARGYISRIVYEARKCFSSSLQNPNIAKLTQKENAPFGAIQTIKLMLELLILQICRGEVIHTDEAVRLGKQARLSESYVESTIEFLKKSIYTDIRIDDICREIKISRSQLQKMFLRTTGKSVMKYLRELRIEEAKFLIRQQKYNYTEIAEKLCYSSVHHFSHQFKELAGMSPSNYAYSINLLTQGIEDGIVN